MILASLSGGSGSGKTTIARQLITLFPKDKIGYLPMDAYYKDHSQLSPEQRNSHNFDHPQSFDFELLLNHLKKLQMSIPVERPVYSYLTCSREKQTVPVNPSEIIIFEGLMALTNDYLREITSVKFFIDVNKENRLQRILDRDIKERGRSASLVTERFHKMIQPMHEIFIEPYKHKADMIIDGNHLRPSVIANLISEELRRCEQVSKIKK